MQRADAVTWLRTTAPGWFGRLFGEAAGMCVCLSRAAKNKAAHRAHGNTPKRAAAKGASSKATIKMSPKAAAAKKAALARWAKKVDQPKC